MSHTRVTGLGSVEYLPVCFFPHSVSCCDRAPSHFHFCDHCEKEGLRQTEEIQLCDRSIGELRNEITRSHKVIRSFRQSFTPRDRGAYDLGSFLAIASFPGIAQELIAHDSISFWGF